MKTKKMTYIVFFYVFNEGVEKTRFTVQNLLSNSTSVFFSKQLLNLFGIKRDRAIEKAYIYAGKLNFT